MTPRRPGRARRRHRPAAAIPHYARLLPELFSLECWGGA
ncbi:hypothetical protein L505_0657, partial [Bordetella bronchiseptica F4563]